MGIPRRSVAQALGAAPGEHLHRFAIARNGDDAVQAGLVDGDQAADEDAVVAAIRNRQPPAAVRGGLAREGEGLRTG
jgi:hypothetical protein